MALPGSVYVYQGDELGLPEVEDIPSQDRQDPMFFRSGGVDPGRDGCRVPMPWSGAEPPYGFSPAGSAPSWLRQPGDWAALTVQAQAADPASTLRLYRDALAIRRTQTSFGESLEWLPAEPGVLAFTRGAGFACLLNLGQEPIALPRDGRVLISSSELEGGGLPADTAVWIQLHARP